MRSKTPLYSLIPVVVVAAFAFHTSGALARVYPVNSDIVSGTVAELRFGGWESGNVVGVRIAGANTGCYFPLAGSGGTTDFVGLRIDDISLTQQRVLLSMLSMAYATQRPVTVEYNQTDTQFCEILFLELN